MFSAKKLVGHAARQAADEPVLGCAKRLGSAGHKETQVLVDGSAKGNEAELQVVLQVLSLVSAKYPSRQVA